jgi:hypothetical protein
MLHKMLRLLLLTVVLHHGAALPGTWFGIRRFADAQGAATAVPAIAPE